MAGKPLIGSDRTTAVRLRLHVTGSSGSDRRSITRTVVAEESSLLGF